MKSVKTLYEFINRQEIRSAQLKEKREFAPREADLSLYCDWWQREGRRIGEDAWSEVVTSIKSLQDLMENLDASGRIRQQIAGRIEALRGQANSRALSAIP